MSEFIQLHLLTSYPPSNLNRDDTGRPKTAMFGTSQRLRVSSQSLKRAFRTSDIFLQALGANVGFDKACGDQIGIRTKDVGVSLIQKELSMDSVDPVTIKEITSKVEKYLWGKMDEKGNPKEKAKEKAKGSGKKNSKVKEEDEVDEEKPEGESGKEDKEDKKALYFLSLQEKRNLDSILDKVRKGVPITDADYASLRSNGHNTPDIALFGRMIANQSKRNVEAACQVAHALSVHKVTVEEDYYSAVDDLNEEDVGAGHLGTTEFGAALFYLYVCVDRSLLLHNLDGDEALAQKTLRALVRAACLISPTGKQNSFASRERAHFVLAERGDQQPRSLSVAFLHPLEGKTLLSSSIDRIQKVRQAMDEAYGACAREHLAFEPVDLGSGKARSKVTFDQLVEFAVKTPGTK